MCERNNLQSIVWDFISIEMVVHYTTKFRSEIEVIVDTLENRLLTNFLNLEAEAEEATEEAWNKYMSQPASEYEHHDPGDFAEAAQEVGIDLYQLLTGIRQGIINLFALALFHCFEQQVALFRERELRFTVIKDNQGELNAFKRQLKYLGVDITNFESWDKIKELRLVANVAKHAEGRSAEKLRCIRPSLLEQSLIGVDSFSLPVRQPLIGEDLYVSIQDIKDYRDYLIGFWDELSGAMQVRKIESCSNEEIYQEDA